MEWKVYREINIHSTHASTIYVLQNKSDNSNNAKVRKNIKMTISGHPLIIDIFLGVREEHDVEAPRTRECPCRHICPRDSARLTVGRTSARLGR